MLVIFLIGFFLDQNVASPTSSCGRPVPQTRPTPTLVQGDIAVPEEQGLSELKSTENTGENTYKCIQTSMCMCICHEVISHPEIFLFDNGLIELQDQ